MMSYELVDVREKQREQLLEMLKKANDQQVVLGNFNSDQGTYELSAFKKDFNFANGKNGVWKNTFPGDDDSVMKSYSIDNILTTKNIQIKNTK